MAGISPEDFNERAKTGFQIGVAPVRIDILHRIDGVQFDEAWERRVNEFQGGIPVYIISSEDLVRNKLASGRPCDLPDIDDIRKAVAARNE